MIERNDYMVGERWIGEGVSGKERGFRNGEVWGQGDREGHDEEEGRGR